MEFKGLQNAENDFEMPPMPIDLSENKTGRFISLSMMLHAALVATVALMSVPPIEFPKKEIIEFEVESETLGAKPIADGTSVPETKGEAAPAPAPAAAPAPVAELPAAPVVPVAKAAPAVSVAPKVAPVVAAPAPAKAPAARASAPAPVAAAAATIDDISAPDLATSDSGEVPVAQMDEKDLQDDFDKVDQANHKALIAAKKSMQEEADQVANDGDAALKEVERENQANAKAIAKAEEARRKSDQAAIAAIEAKEKADAEKASRLAAKQAADRDAAAAKAAAAREALIAREGEEANARLAALKEAHQGQGTGDEGEGTGQTGSPEPTKEVAGIPGGVRTLEQLRQMPGNKFPQYSSEERLARQEGNTMFYAYVNKDGSLSQFKLGQSTGYRNLDGKTLAALKKWKFYPGQEGWVEMPFKWSLNGEALEAGGTLRNKATK